MTLGMWKIPHLFVQDDGFHIKKAERLNEEKPFLIFNSFSVQPKKLPF